jgi:hypothetical protein
MLADRPPTMFDERHAYKQFRRVWLAWRRVSVEAGHDEPSRSLNKKLRQAAPPPDGPFREMLE